MKKTLFILLAIFACIGSYPVVFAQQQPVVAVAPFEATSGITTAEANMITRVFFIRLGNTNRVSLVDRNVVDRVLREHSFQAGDWSNEQKTAELGRALNSDWIVRGELEKFGDNILVTVQFYDIQTFRFMGGADTLLANAAEAMEKMDPLVNRLVQTIASAGERTPRQQGGNVAASAYHGTWIQRSTSSSETLIIDSNRVIIRFIEGSTNRHVIISNPTWTAVSNIDHNTLSDYPRGFSVFGAITEHNRQITAAQFRPIYIFLHRNDNNRMLLYLSPDGNSEIQSSTPLNTSSGPFGRVQ